MPALFRCLTVSPAWYDEAKQDDEDAFTWSRAVAFQIRTQSSRLQRDTLVRMGKLLWSRRIQVWGDSLGHARSLASLATLYNEELKPDRTEWTGDSHQGPCDWLGMEPCETLWVLADSGHQDLDAAFLPGIDKPFADRVRAQILAAYAEAAEQAVQSAISKSTSDGHVAGELAYQAGEAPELISGLIDSFDVFEPLDLYEAWHRHRATFAASHASLRIKSLVIQYPGAVDIALQPDGSLAGFAWRVIPFPPREELVARLWPQSDHAQVLRDMPASLFDPAWLPYLHVWSGEATEILLQRREGAAPWIRESIETPGGGQLGLIVTLDHRVHVPSAAHPRAAEWIERYASEVGVLIRFHVGLRERTVPTLDPETIHTVMSRFVKRLETITIQEDGDEPVLVATWPARQKCFVVPAWHDGQAVSFEQAVFGDQGRLLLNHVDDWPENLPSTFGATDNLLAGGDANTTAQRGPANMLRRGLGTWINRSISSRGQQLLYQVLTNQSPIAFQHMAHMAPPLLQVPEPDRLALSQLLACEAARDLWGHEFSWNVAFCLGGSLHAAVEVRGALQERMRFTKINPEMPGWTLRGPSELTFVQFSEPLAVGTRTYSAKPVRRRVVGAYIWSKERRLDTGEPIPFGTALDRGESLLDLSIALVGSDQHEPALRRPDGYFTPFFLQYRWTGLDPDMSLNDMISTLTSSLEEARLRKAASPLLHKDDDYEPNALETLRHDREAFDLTLKELSKVLLYMQMREARIEHDDKVYGDNVGRGEHPLLPPKNKDARASTPKPRETLFHRIRVGPIRFDDGGPEDATGGDDGSSSGGKRAPHPRIGHIRNQAYGPGWRDHRPVWIRPQWIGMKTDHSGPPRLYDVG